MLYRLLLLLPIFALLQACAPSRQIYGKGTDAYPSFGALRAGQAEGRDYSREVYERGSQVAVFAIHGGDIERGTSLVARQTAGSDFNLYLFSGWLGDDSRKLHVTAAHFDDPDAVRLATSSLLGVSIHAQADRGSYVCIGGRNEAAARRFAQRLESAGFAAETPCLRLPGTSDKNIVNRPAAGGVQLELTARLLRRLERSPEELARFAGALRLAAVESLEMIQRERAAQQPAGDAAVTTGE